MLAKLLLIGVGGGVGAVLRYIVSISLSALTQNFQYGFLSTFCINMLACICIGICFALLRDNSSLLYLFFAVGILGGFSTFSTFSLEVFKLLQNGFVFVALGYVLFSNVFGVLCVWLGYTQTKILQA